MKRALYLALVALVAMLIMVPTAMAQEEAPAEIAEEQVEDPQEPVEENVAEAEAAAAAQPKMEGTMMKETTSPLPKSGGIGIGGPSLLLPAIALVMGGGVLGYAVLRRR